MKKQILFILITIAFVGCKESKHLHGTGALPFTHEDSAIINRLPVISFNQMRSESLATQPAADSILMPPVQDQGAEGSCTANACSYTRDAEQYYLTGVSSYTTSTNIFSTEFLYNQTKVSSGCGSGSSMITTLEFLKSKGVCTWASMPSVEECSLLPTSAQTNEAANYKIASYSVVHAPDTIAVRTMINNRHPLLAQISIDNNFEFAGPGYVWKSFGNYFSNHMITIVGYDNARRRYRAINSWGTNWGTNGYIWIDYDFFLTIAYNLYVMTPASVTCPTNGTLLRTSCVGYDKYGIYANGTCGEYTALIAANSPDCGYVPPPSDTTRPVVTSITTNLPVGNVIPRSNKNVNIYAKATDNVGVESMAIFVDDKQICNPPGDNISCSWSSKFATSGKHIIKVKAWDKAGNVGESNPVIVYNR